MLQLREKSRSCVELKPLEEVPEEFVKALSTKRRLEARGVSKSGKENSGEE
jgi:hypothetical protein